MRLLSVFVQTLTMRSLQLQSQYTLRIAMINQKAWTTKAYKTELTIV